MIILPFRPRRAWLMSFWLVFSVFSGSILGAFLSVYASPRWSILGIIWAILWASLGFMRPQIISIPYTVWNTMARTFARAARGVLKVICFYIILVAAGRAGSSLRLSRPASGESLWLPRRALANTGYFHQYDAPGQESLQKGWIRTYFSWAAQSV